MPAALAAPTRPSTDEAARWRDDGAKRRQILDGARSVFLSLGFDAASMNEVARAAGVSKGTLYVYFDSKESLFEALIREEKREQAEQTCVFDHADHDVAAVLRGFGERLLDRMLRETAVRHFRIVVAVAPRIPAIGQAFWEAGPAVGRARLAAYLDAQVAAGVIEIDDCLTAAALFLDMCKSLHLLPVMLGVAPTPSEQEIAAHVATAAATFLRAYPLRRV